MNWDARFSLLFKSHFYSFKVRLHKNARRFLSQISGRVLDVGAGSEPYRCYLRQGVAYVSVDTDTSYCPDVVGSALQLGFVPGTFDSVICTEVLEHVPEPLRALLEINKALKQGGHLYLTAPMTWGLHYEPFDYFRFTKYGLEYLLQESDFDIVESVKIGGLFIAMLARLEDVVMNLLYRLSFPLKIIMKNSTRIATVSVLMFPFIVCLDFLATFLDTIIPGANRDALGWVIFARKR